MMGQESRYKDLGPLHDLLLKACPSDGKQKRSIPVLAKHLGISHQYIYRWLATKRVPASFGKQLVSMSEGRVTYEQLQIYVFK